MSVRLPLPVESSSQYRMSAKISWITRRIDTARAQQSNTFKVTAFAGRECCTTYDGQSGEIQPQLQRQAPQPTRCLYRLPLLAALAYSLAMHRLWHVLLGFVCDEGTA
eukprot:scaffold227002_cov13-Tisochrysis_lutea.AAC.1